MKSNKNKISSRAPQIVSQLKMNLSPDDYLGPAPASEVVRMEVLYPGSYFCC